MKLDVIDVRAGYGGTPVLGPAGGVSLGIEPGTCTAIVGANGSGKSTLLRVACGLLRPLSGRADLGGRDVRTIPKRELARVLSVVPQSPVAPPGATVREVVGLGRYPHIGWHGALRPKDRELVEEAMARCEIGHLRDRSLTTLSGGERQRAWVAMALAQQPRVLLLDEPISALDVRHQLEVLRLVSSLCAHEGTGVVMVLHDLNLAARFADRIIALHDGAVSADGVPSDVVCADVVRRVFGVRVHVDTDAETGRPWCRPYEIEGVAGLSEGSR